MLLYSEAITLRLSWWGHVQTNECEQESQFTAGWEEWRKHAEKYQQNSWFQKAVSIRLPAIKWNGMPFKIPTLLSFYLFKCFCFYNKTFHIEFHKITEHQCVLLVILATREVETGYTEAQGQPRQRVHETPSPKYPEQNGLVA
jgi:hypothetical protein